ncbi:hypothetical protein [Telluria aromaticivorans]|uniref:Uncharacterized protein n=1 Tax=Telluria aromaticivorans TaxID=2725995 RepID=A0A7Y2NX86_9BURK|nr:hypothetical protein [Telluria aromaticivorans]NNG21447.1 hypothetical protein [Telluria aromaticivorans]
MRADLTSFETSIEAFRYELSPGIDDGGTARERPRNLLALTRSMVELASSTMQLELQAHGRADSALE